MFNHLFKFQLSNANSLIKSLRAKVSQQKELISKAKQELAGQKLLKEKIKELQQDNDKLRRKYTLNIMRFLTFVTGWRM